MHCIALLCFVLLCFLPLLLLCFSFRIYHSDGTVIHFTAPIMLSQIGSCHLLSSDFRTLPAPHFAGMPRSLVRCLVCKSHYSMARRECHICWCYRALPSCRPEHCWIEETKSCRDCLRRLLVQVGLHAARETLPERPLRAILACLQEAEW